MGSLWLNTRAQAVLGRVMEVLAGVKRLARPPLAGQAAVVRPVEQDGEIRLKAVADHRRRAVDPVERHRLAVHAHALQHARGGARDAEADHRAGRGGGGGRRGARRGGTLGRRARRIVTQPVQQVAPALRRRRAAAGRPRRGPAPPARARCRAAPGAPPAPSPARSGAGAWARPRRRPARCRAGPAATRSMPSSRNAWAPGAAGAPNGRLASRSTSVSSTISRKPGARRTARRGSTRRLAATIHRPASSARKPATSSTRSGRNVSHRLGVGLSNATSAVSPCAQRNCPKRDTHTPRRPCAGCTCSGPSAVRTRSGPSGIAAGSARSSGTAASTGACHRPPPSARRQTSVPCQVNRNTDTPLAGRAPGRA